MSRLNEKELVAKGYMVLGHQQKSIPPVGATGGSEWRNEYVQAEWVDQPTFLSVRMRPDTFAIDLDTDPKSAHATEPMKETQRLWVEFRRAFGFSAVRTGANRRNGAGIYHFRLEGLTEPDIAVINVPNVDVIRCGHRFAVVRGTHPNGNVYTGELPPVDELPVFTKEMLDWWLERSAPKQYREPGAITVDMPPRVEVTKAERMSLDLGLCRPLRDRDWSEVGGRKHLLFSGAQRAAWHLSGTPEERMGKALSYIEAYLQEAYAYADRTKANRYASLEHFWADNPGLSECLEALRQHAATDQIRQEVTDGTFRVPAKLPRRGVRRKTKAYEWLPGEKLVKGTICMLVAPTKVGKTTFTFGHLVSEAIQGGLRLVVISNETNATAVRSYAHAHGYGDAYIEPLSTPDVPRDEWDEVEDFVMGQDGLFNIIRAATMLDGGSPAVIVIESPEEFITAADGVKFIGDSSNLDPIASKQLMTRIQNELLAPGGHAMVWSTHTASNDVEGRVRGGQAGAERVRLLYKMHGSVESGVTVTARGNIYKHPQGLRAFTMTVKPIPLEARKNAAKEEDVSLFDAAIPEYVFAALIPKNHVPSVIDDAEIEEGTYTAGEMLEMLGIDTDSRNPGRVLEPLIPEITAQGWRVARSGRKYIITREQHDEEPETEVGGFYMMGEDGEHEKIA